MVRFRYYEDILEIYDIYTEDISSDILEMFFEYIRYDLYILSNSFTIFYVHSEDIRKYFTEMLYECFMYIRYDHSILRMSKIFV